jgi:hypothetical protein
MPGTGDTDGYYNDSVQDSTNMVSEYDSNVGGDGYDMSMVQSLQDSFDISHIDLTKLSSQER